MLLLSIYLGLLGVLDALESSFPLNVLQLRANENLTTKKRVYYTDISVLDAYKYSGYSTPVNTTNFGLASPEMECEIIDTLCPQLIQLFHVTDGGSPRLVTYQELAKNSSFEIIEEAGYVGSWPGYCGTANGALVEMFSPVLKAYRYMTSNEELVNARKNSDRLFWHPTKVLGYLYDSTIPKRVIKYPFNAIRPFDNPVFNKVSITLRPIIQVTKDNTTVNTVSLRNNNFLDGYNFTRVLNVSFIDRQSDKNMIEDACGKMTMISETYDSDSGAYRLRDPKKGAMERNEDTVKLAGYVFREESSAKRCLGDVEPIYEFQNPNKTNEFHYVSSFGEASNYEMTKKWKNLGQLGYSSWGNFVFARR